MLLLYNFIDERLNIEKVLHNYNIIMVDILENNIILDIMPSGLMLLSTDIGLDTNVV